MTYEELTAGQRAMMAADAVSRGSVSFDNAIPQFRTSKTSLRRALRIKQLDSKSHHVASELRRGYINLDEASRRVGLSTSNGPTALRKGQSFGRGDRWFQAAEPLKRYLRLWRDREYTHLNPKEARRRLAQVRELQDGLAIIEAELELRSAKATLTV